MNMRKQYLKRKQSKSTVRGFTLNKDEQTVFPNFSFESAMSLIDSDPVARGAMNRFVNKCMEGDSAVIDKKTFEYVKEEHLRLQEKYQFRVSILRKLFLMLKLYNNSFIEIVKDSDNNTKSLNVLDTTTVKPVTAPNGDALKYISKIEDPATGKYPEWSKDEIVWVKYGDRTSGFAPLDLRALWNTIKAKEYVTRYVAWLWKTGQYRVLYNPKQASQQSIDDFLTWMTRHDENYQMPMLLKGELETKILRDIKETEGITMLLSYYDNQILVGLGMPPISVGIPDSSGRSNSDQQDKDLASLIADIKTIVADSISYELFPRINKGTYLFRFGPIDRYAEKQAWEVVQIMQSVGASRDVMKEHLQDRGLFYETTDVFEPSMLEQAGGNPRAQDMNPSRLGKGEGEKSQAIGTGEQGTTRSDQLRNE